MADIPLKHLRKTYGKVVAIGDLSLDIKDGEFLVLLGPSGCGKSTTLRALAGLEVLDRGRILIGGRDVTALPPGKRGIGMVFQSYALFPHMKVADNIVFGLRMRNVPLTEQRGRVAEVAELLQITGLLDRYPAQLSGGQRQRVAVARAIVMQPDVLLMDEPLSNLDALLRLHMRAELKRIHREVRSTTVYVTAPAAHAGRAETDPPGGPLHDSLRDARPSGGAQPGRPHRRDAGGGDRPVRHAGAHLQRSGEPVRRQLHRQSADELPERHAADGRRTAGGRGGRRSDSP